MTDPGACIDAVSRLVGLDIAPDYRPGVTRYLGIAADMAAILDAVALDDADLALTLVYLPPDRPNDPT